MTAALRVKVDGFPKYYVTADGEVYGPRGLLRHEIIKGGYHRVSLANDEGRRHKLVHILVAAAFIGPAPDGMQVNHIDGNKDNNAASNLEYVTPSENVRHSLDVIGVIRARGERNSQAKLTVQQVREMRRQHAAGLPIKAMAASYGIDFGHAWRIVTHRAWRHVA